MSKTRLEDSLRLAIYDAYKGKCFYTEEPVSYIDFEVDHIIPESQESDIENIKKRLGLEDDFYINSIENLVPCRPGINLRKSGRMFPDNMLLFYFEQTKARKPTIVALHEKYKKQSKRSNGYKTIDKLLVSGTISIEELDDYIHWKKMKQWRNKTITLNYPIHFTDGEMRELSINDSHREILMKTLDLFGDGKGVELVGDNDKRVEVHSLSEWKEYTEKGYYPNTNADIRMSGTFEFLDGLLSALDIAQKPRQSYVEGKNMRELLGRFPASMLINIENGMLINIENGITDVTIGELVKDGKAEIIKQEDYSVCVRYGGFLNTFSEQFRADLTNDGIENIFCYVWRNADGGSMGWGETMILGCHSADGAIEEEKLYKK